jgi:ATP-binding cassette subfamily G (WHITE) protein 2 (PDR)
MEREARWGFEHLVPTTAEEFAARWKASPEFAALQDEITAFSERHPMNGPEYDNFLSSRRQQQSKHT